MSIGSTVEVKSKFLKPEVYTMSDTILILEIDDKESEEVLKYLKDNDISDIKIIKFNSPPPEMARDIGVVTSPVLLVGDTIYTGKEAVLSALKRLNK